MADQNDNLSEKNEPIVTDEEMKMPEEGLNNQADKHSSILGLVLAVLIVVLVLILGGLYLWGTTINNPPADIAPIERPTAEENDEPESNNAEAEVQALETVSTSDELEAIEADLESTNFEELDAEMTAIEAELDAAFE